MQEKKKTKYSTNVELMFFFFHFKSNKFFIIPMLLQAMESKAVAEEEEEVEVVMAVPVKKAATLVKVAVTDVIGHDVITMVIIVDRVALVHSNNNKARMAVTVVHVMIKASKVAMAPVKVAHHLAVVVVDVADVVHHHVVSIVATSVEEEAAVVHQDDHEAKMARLV